MSKPSANAILPHFRTYLEFAPEKARALAACDTDAQLEGFAKNCETALDSQGFMLAHLLRSLKPPMRKWVVRIPGASTARA